MITYGLLFLGLVGGLAALIGGVIWTIKLGTAIVPPGDIATPQLMSDSFRLFPWPKPEK